MKAAKAWARSHGFRYGKVDVSGSRAQYIRLRQHDPSEYRPSTFRTISLDADETVKAIVGVPLRAAAATRPAGYDSRGPRKRTNPFGKYRGVSYYHTAGVYRAHMPDGTTQVFGASDGGKRGMQEFIDGFLWPARSARANPRSAFAAHPGYDPPSEWAVFNRQGEKFGIYKARSEDAAISQALAYYGVAPEDADPTLRAAPVPDGSLARWRTTRRNGAPRVRVPGLGLGVVVAQRPGGMVDVRLSSGTVVRKPASSLTPA